MKGNVYYVIFFVYLYKFNFKFVLCNLKSIFFKKKFYCRLKNIYFIMFSSFGFLTDMKLIFDLFVIV